MILKGQLYQSAKHGWKARVIRKDENKWVLFVFDVFDDDGEKLELLVDNDDTYAQFDLTFLPE